MIDDETLAKIAKALNVAVDDIKYLNEDSTITIINVNDNGVGAENYYDNSVTNNNPLDMIGKLYERIIEKEKEIVELKAKLKEYEK